MAVPGKRKAVRGAGGVEGYFATTRSPMVAAVVTLPLLLLYNLGLLMPGNSTLNAADLLTTLLLEQAGLTGFLVVNGLLVLVSVVLMVVLARQGRLKPSHWLAICAEGLFLGLLLGHSVLYVMGQAQLLAVDGGHDLSLAQALSVSAGAGYWEEIVFRLAMVGGPIALARRQWSGRSFGDVSRVVLVGAVAVILSSLLFSLAHYLGSESLDPFTFWYRSLSGLVFSAIFLVRGFAVAAYTHFLYDVVVLVF